MDCKIYSIYELKCYKFVVVLSKYKGKILLSRHKNRNTWETQGGHIEQGETPIEAAKRELFEESGALGFEIKPVCDYWAGDTASNHGANGMVFCAEIYELGTIPESEMAEVKMFDTLPDNLTYPDITPTLFNQLVKYQSDGLEARELLIDLHNYLGDGTFTKRKAVRGIIQNNGRYLLIHSKFGEYKFPGGGMEKGESFEQTPFREVQEETGYLVNNDSTLMGPVVHERRKGDPDDLMIMDSFYFYCNVNKCAGKRNLDDYEEDYDYQVSWIALEDAIANNESIKDYENIPWIKRDTMVMRSLLQN